MWKNLGRSPTVCLTLTLVYLPLREETLDESVLPECYLLYCPSKSLSLSSWTEPNPTQLPNLPTTRDPSLSLLSTFYLRDDVRLGSHLTRSLFLSRGKVVSWHHRTPPVLGLVEGKSRKTPSYRSGGSREVHEVDTVSEGKPDGRVPRGVSVRLRWK